MRRRVTISWGKMFLVFFTGMVFVFLVLPSLMAVPMSITSTEYLVFPPRGLSLKWFHRFITDEEWLNPVFFSLKLATLSTLVSLILGIMVSFVLVRGSLPGRKLLQVFFISPIMIPVIITSVAVYGLFAKLHLIGTMTGMVLAHTMLCIPFVILVASANLYRFDISMEMAARNLGANAIKTFIFITMPLIKPGIIAAGIFCFITSLDELVLAMFLIGTRKMTLPIKVFSQIHFRLDPVVAVASTVFIFAAIATVICLAIIKPNKK